MQHFIGAVNAIVPNLDLVLTQRLKSKGSKAALAKDNDFPFDDVALRQ